ncbi:hypothetical protein [Cytobacillus oceanisediminis]|uniref:hypothetical protein n=1 Tax=Cytobacillus oceanisediminis TaxID=665099 RepID=UPI001FB26D75|nr:hypothetical protein [Cytobacillus oceanisediminis]UOE56435.1 hypothetical protein IRB79_06700 [Cytobacillus oceanisediminis]
MDGVIDYHYEIWRTIFEDRLEGEAVRKVLENPFPPKVPVKEMRPRVPSQIVKRQSVTFQSLYEILNFCGQFDKKCLSMV